MEKNSNHKPLVIYGARQIGKTFSILNFANNNYENVIYINFSEDKRFLKIVKESFKPKDIISEILAIKRDFNLLKIRQ